MARNSTRLTRLSPQALALVKRAAEIEGRSVDDLVAAAAQTQDIRRHIANCFVASPVQ